MSETMALPHYRQNSLSGIWAESRKSALECQGPKADIFRETLIRHASRHL